MRWGVLLVVLLVGASASALHGAAQLPGTVNENFDGQPPDGWQLPPSASIQAVGRSNALVFNGPGMAVTPMTCGQTFTLTFRLGLPNGTASILMCWSGAEGQDQMYRLGINPEEAGLDRIMRGAAQHLRGGETRLAGRQWAQVSIARTGGEIRVGIDGQQIIVVQDPNPLPGGGLALGCMHGSVVYDDITLSGGGAALIPAIPINIPGMAVPGQTPEPGTGPMINPMVAQPLPAPGQQGQVPLQGASQPQAGPVMAPMVAQPLPGPGMTQAVLDPGALGQVRQPIPAHVAQALSRPPTRAEMVQSLLADPRTAAQLQAIPTAPGLPVQQLASTGLSGNPTQRVALVPAGSAGSGAGAAQVSNQALVQIWEGGVSFTPAIARPAAQVGGTLVPLGGQRVFHVILDENLTDVSAANVVTLLTHTTSLSTNALVDLDLRLPAGPATYMIAVKIGVLGQAPASHVAGNPPLLSLLVNSSLYNSVQLVPLQDGSGYVGVYHVNVPPVVGMHPYNTRLTLCLDTSPEAQNQVPYGERPMDHHSFGGITVTRL